MWRAQSSGPSVQVRLTPEAASKPEALVVPPKVPAGAAGGGGGGAGAGGGGGGGRQTKGMVDVKYDWESDRYAFKPPPPSQRGGGGGGRGGGGGAGAGGRMRSGKGWQILLATSSKAV